MPAGTAFSVFPSVFSPQPDTLPLQIQRTLRLLDGPHRHAVGVDHGGFEACVAEQFLNDPDIVVRLQEMGGEGVAEGVGINRLRTEGRRLKEMDARSQQAQGV